MILQNVIDTNLSQCGQKSEELCKTPKFLQIRIPPRIGRRSPVFNLVVFVIDYPAVSYVEVGVIRGTWTVSWIFGICTKNFDVEI